MRIKTRWIETVIKTAATLDQPLPWERGVGRTMRIARRNKANHTLHQISA